MISVQSPNPLISANNENKGNRLDGLTTRQDRALKALLDSPSIVAADANDSWMAIDPNGEEWRRGDHGPHPRNRDRRRETVVKANSLDCK